MQIINGDKYENEWVLVGCPWHGFAHVYWQEKWWQIWLKNKQQCYCVTRDDSYPSSWLTFILSTIHPLNKFIPLLVKTVWVQNGCSNRIVRYEDEAGKGYQYLLAQVSLTNFKTCGLNIYHTQNYKTGGNNLRKTKAVYMWYWLGQVGGGKLNQSRPSTI